MWQCRCSPMIEAKCTSVLINYAFRLSVPGIPEMFPQKVIQQRNTITAYVWVNLNTSDSGLHHTISLMYVGARHLGFGITKHIVTSPSMYRMLYMLYFARSPVRRNWPSSSDCALFKMFRLVRNRRTAFAGFRKNYSSAYAFWVRHILPQDTFEARSPIRRNWPSSSDWCLGKSPYQAPIWAIFEITHVWGPGAYNLGYCLEHWHRSISGIFCTNMIEGKCKEVSLCLLYTRHSIHDTECSLLIISETI